MVQCWSTQNFLGGGGAKVARKQIGIHLFVNIIVMKKKQLNVDPYT